MADQRGFDTLDAHAGRERVPAPPSSRAWLILGAVSVAQLMLVLDATIMNIALPSAQKSLGFSDVERQWVVTAYALTFGSLLLLGGRIGDILSRKLAFLIGLAGFAVASALAGAAPTFAILIGARALQGAFGALLAPAALAVLAETFNDTSGRSKAFGIFGAVSGAGAGLGLVLGGGLTEFLSWRWTLYVNILFAAAVMIAGIALLANSKRVNYVSLDIPGAIQITSGFFLLVYGLGTAESEGLGTSHAPGFIASGTLLIAAFVWWQTRAPSPLLPLAILRDRIRAGAFLAVFFSSAGMFAQTLFLTFYLQRTLAFTPLEGGLSFLPMNISIITSAVLLTPPLIDRFGPRIVVSLGMVACAAAMAALMMLGLTSSYIAHVLPSLIVMGFGMGTVIGTSMGLATLGVDRHDVGAASATLNSMLQVGGSMGVAVLTGVAASAVSAWQAAQPPGAANLPAQKELAGSLAAFGGCAVIYMIGAVVTYFTYPAKNADRTANAEAGLSETRDLHAR